MFGLVGMLFCGSLSGCTWVRNCVGKCPEKSLRLAEQARLAEESGEIPQAVAYFDDALEESPDDPHFHREVARLLMKLNQPQLALVHLEQAVEHNPDDVEANVELAELYIDADQAGLAAEHLDAALQNDPKHITALVSRAKLAERLDGPRPAIEMYHRVLCADPNHVEARVRIASLQLEQHQPTLSAPLLRSVCQSSRATPDEIAEARWVLGIAYGQEHRWSDAVIALSAASEHFHELSADDWYRLAYARGQISDWDGAREDLDKALSINPHHENAEAMLDLIRRQEETPAAPILRIGHSVKPIPVPELW